MGLREIALSPHRGPGLIPTLGAAAFIAVTVFLGNWQSGRAETKRALAEEFDRRSAGAVVTLSNGTPDTQEMQFRRIRVQGEFDATRTIFIDNRVHQGAVGYYVVTPMRVASTGRYILVNRGWLKAGARRDVLPEVPTPSGVTTVQGIAVVPPQRVFELAQDTASGPVRQHLLPERLEAEWRVPLYRIVLQQNDGGSDGLVRKWERPDTGVDKHRAYALQWYSFAGLCLILYVVFGFRRTTSG